MDLVTLLITVVAAVLAVPPCIVAVLELFNRFERRGP